MRRPVAPTLTTSDARTQLELVDVEALALAPQDELLAQADVAKTNACAVAAETNAVARVNDLDTSAEADIFRKVVALLGRGLFTVAHEEGFLQRQAALKEREPFLHGNVLVMAQAALMYDQAMQRLERRVRELEVEVSVLAAVRRFEYWRGVGEVGKSAEKITGAGEDVVLGVGSRKGAELVDLREWPLPPRTSWVMVQGERKKRVGHVMS